MKNLLSFYNNYFSLPEIPRNSEQFKTFIWCLKTLKPDYYFKFKESCGHDQGPHEEGEDQTHPAEHLPSSLPMETLTSPKNTEKKIEAGEAALFEVDKLLLSTRKIQVVVNTDCQVSQTNYVKVKLTCIFAGVHLQRQGCNGAMWQVWTGLSHPLYRPTSCFAGGKLVLLGP